MDIKRLKEKVEKLLNDHNVDANTLTDANGRGETYIVPAQEAQVRITLGNAWIGYELIIDKPVLGKRIGFSEDTDNYPLEGNNVEAALGIYGHAFKCAASLLQGKILVGKDKRKYVLVIPVEENSFRVIYKGAIISKEAIFNKDQLKKLRFLRPID